MHLKLKVLSTPCRKIVRKSKKAKYQLNQIIVKASEGFGFLKKFPLGPALSFTLAGVLCIGFFGFVKPSFEDDESIENEFFHRQCKIPEIKSPTQFFDMLEDTTNFCKNLTSIGGKPWEDTGVMDGDKKVCMDPELDFKRGNCTVLSFGILKDWTFDDEMDITYNCKVFSFDPTIGYKNHERSSRLKFFNLGLGKIDGYKALNGKIAKVNRYGTIINDLGLQGLTIDYLKMDVEGSEVHFFNQVLRPSSNLLSNVRQIGMEIHPGRADFDLLYLKFWEAFHTLKCHGFQLVFSTPNLVTTNHYNMDGKVRSTCYEVLWVNSGKHPL